MELGSMPASPRGDRLGPRAAAERRVVLVLGDRLTLSALAITEPIQPSLVGAATTEDEGLELVLRTQPDLLICSSDLETGYAR